MRDKPTIPNTWTTVGVWNSNILYLPEPIPINPYLTQLCCSITAIYWGCQRFSFFFVGTSVEEETRQSYLILWLVLEYGIVTYSFSLHQFLSIFISSQFCCFFYQPSNMGVNDLAIFVGTWFKERTNQLHVALFDILTFVLLHDDQVPVKDFCT